MADIFISYAKARAAEAAALAGELGDLGFDVWWDTSLLPTGSFGAAIDKELDAAKAVIVVWTPQSARSLWVKSEAGHGLRQEKLVNTHTGDLGSLQNVPKPFDQIHSVVVADIRAIVRALDALGVPRSGRAAAAAEPPAPSAAHGPDGDDRLFAEVERQGTLAAYEYYIAEMPEGRHVLVARFRADGLKRATAEETARRQAAEEAEAKRKAEAERRRIEELTRRHEADWQTARAADTIAALEAFLAAWTGGPHVEETRRRLAELSAAAKAPPRPLVRTGQFQVMAGPKGQDKELWLNPGEIIRDADFAPELVLVPPGKFWMGSSDADIAALTKQHGDYFKREGPRHEVTVGYPLLVGKYPVTFAEWDAYVAKAGGGGFLGIGGSKPHKPGDSGWGRGQRPVIDVSWDDGKAYAKWLSEATGKKGYRLLSEAEWEYCCRAGMETQYSFGDAITKKQAQFSEGSYGSAKQTVDVGSFPANAFGLHDMHGNVWEWCEDPWHENYKGAPVDGSVWTAGGDTNLRVLRGGSWNSDPRSLRSAYRNGNRPGDRVSDLGVRLARMLTP